MTHPLQFPTPASVFLQSRLHEHGINGIALLAAVPFYMSDTAYPAGASALLGTLSEYADLSLPVGELEQGAAEDQETIDSLVGANPEILQTVSALEDHYDAWSGEGGDIPVGALGQDTDLANALKPSKDIGEVLEAYLANLDMQGQDRHVEAEADVSEPEEDPLAAALRRVEERRRFPSGPRSHVPLHRAPDTPEDTVAGDGIDTRVRGSAFPSGDEGDPAGADESSD